jgi:arylsulfatase A-like enzyme
VVVSNSDDSGYGDTQVYGAPSTLTPSINKMAAAGARFTQWYSAHAICTPSRAALMTGRLPIRYGLAATSTGGQGVFSCTAKTGLPEDEITIAAVLKKQGFKTMMVGKCELLCTTILFDTTH